MAESELESEAMDGACAVARKDGEAPTRRGLLGWVTGASALGFLAMPAMTAAGKRRKHKKRKQKKHEHEHETEAVTCEEQCYHTCARCFHRPEDTPLCSSQGAAYCNLNCTTDSNCVGTGHPYCTTGQYHFASGTFQKWDCPNGNTTLCSDVEPCG